MKKFLTLIAVAGMFSFYSCGPSAEELAAKAKATADSIAAVEAEAAAAAARAQATADSLAAVEAAAAAEKAKADSLAAAEEAAKSKGKGGAPKSNKPKEVVPKTVVAPGGRGGATKQ